MGGEYWNDSREMTITIPGRSNVNIWWRGFAFGAGTMLMLMSKLLAENPDERRMFDSGVQVLGQGNVLRYIAGTLLLWHKMAPEGGSYREQLAIMSNELMKATGARTDEQSATEPK